MTAYPVHVAQTRTCTLDRLDNLDHNFSAFVNSMPTSRTLPKALIDDEVKQERRDGTLWMNTNISVG